MHARTTSATAATAHTVRSSCTASIAAEQCWLAATTDHGHRHREGAAGGRDGGAPGRLVHRAAASLQGTLQRRRWALAACMLHRACCALPAHVCSQLREHCAPGNRLKLHLPLRLNCFGCDWRRSYWHSPTRLVRGLCFPLPTSTPGLVCDARRSVHRTACSVEHSIYYSICIYR